MLDLHGHFALFLAHEELLVSNDCWRRFFCLFVFFPPCTVLTWEPPSSCAHAMHCRRNKNWSWFDSAMLDSWMHAHARDDTQDLVGTCERTQAHNCVHSSHLFGAENVQGEVTLLPWQLRVCLRSTPAASPASSRAAGSARGSVCSWLARAIAASPRRASCSPSSILFLSELTRCCSSETLPFYTSFTARRV